MCLISHTPWRVRPSYLGRRITAWYPPPGGAKCCRTERLPPWPHIRGRKETHVSTSGSHMYTIFMSLFALFHLYELCYNYWSFSPVSKQTGFFKFVITGLIFEIGLSNNRGMNNLKYSGESKQLPNFYKQ